MKTYQDLLKVGDADKDRMAFIQAAISDHESSEAVRIARLAEEYYRHLNPTIMHYDKIVYDVYGQMHIDGFAPNHKIPCRYYYYFVNQAVMYLLSNGVTFKNESTKEKLGGVEFDHAAIDVAIKAMNGGVSFGFLNVDHVELLPLVGGAGQVSFVPLYDEDNGALMAGIRFWQIDSTKPLRCTLFEVEGMTEYIKRKGEDMVVLKERRPYKLNVGTSDASGEEIYAGENWEKLPIVPMFNANRQSELVGSQKTLDAYDLMTSDMVNNVSEGNLIYWVIQNADGMTEAEDQRFIEKLKSIHVAHTDDNQQIEPVTVEAPYQANEASLERLRKQLFEDFMALDTENIASGAATATQIRAAYERLNIKSGILERNVTAWIMGLLDLLGIKDEAPTYQRDTIVNKAEEVQTLLQAANNLSEEYVTKKLLTILGDIDQVDEVLKAMETANAERMLNY